MATTAELSENSHQGFEGIKAALWLDRLEAKPNVASGMEACLRPNGTGSRCSGKERDAESGLDYFLARYYSGAQGRFTSPDEFKGGIVDPFTGQDVEQPGPLPYADITNPQTLNKYAYVRNNPLRYVDPDGRFALPWELLDLYSYNLSAKAWVQAVHDFRNNPSIKTGLAAAGKFLENAYDSVALLTPGLPAVAGLTGKVGDIFKGAKMSSEVFATAIEGGKHSGFLKNYMSRDVGELASGIKSIEKQIALHLGKIEDPTKHVKDWANLSDLEKTGLISKWNKDIQRQREQKEILEQLKKLREEGR